MPARIHFGRILYGLGMIALGALGAAYTDFVLEWTPTPAQFPGRAAIAYVHAIILIVAGIALFSLRTARPAAMVLAAVWFVWDLLHLPLLITNWRAGLGGQFEILVMTSGFVILAAVLSEPPKRTWAMIARYAFAISMPMFGIVHTLYPTFVAAWIPHWIPGPAIFWVYFTAAAFCAAGLAILTGVLSQLAACLFAAMLSSWVLILHIPRVLRTPHDRHEWTTLFVAIALTGAAWTLSGSMAKMKTTKS
jgi:uncharacterized membrane protein